MASSASDEEYSSAAMQLLAEEFARELENKDDDDTVGASSLFGRQPEI